MTYIKQSLGACKLENTSVISQGSNVNAFSTSIEAWFFYSQNKIPAIGPIAMTILSTTGDGDGNDLSTVRLSSRRVGSFMGHKCSNSQQTILPTIVVNNESSSYDFVAGDSGDTITAQNIDTFIISCR
jgi:hypothetical protein